MYRSIVFLLIIHGCISQRPVIEIPIDIPMEIVAIADDSLDLVKHRRDRLWEKISHIYTHVTVAPGHSRVAVTAHPSMREAFLNETPPRIFDFTDNLKIVKRLDEPLSVQPQSDDYQAATMKDVRENIFPKARPGILKVVIIYYTCFGAGFSFVKAKEEARKLREMGVVIYLYFACDPALVRTNYERDLTEITGDKSHVFDLDSKDLYEHLKKNEMCNYNEVCGYGEVQLNTCRVMGWWRSKTGTSVCKDNAEPNTTSNGNCPLIVCNLTCVYLVPLSIPCDVKGARIEEYLKYCPDIQNVTCVVETKTLWTFNGITGAQFLAIVGCLVIATAVVSIIVAVVCKHRRAEQSIKSTIPSPFTFLKGASPMVVQRSAIKQSPMGTVGKSSMIKGSVGSGKTASLGPSKSSTPLEKSKMDKSSLPSSKLGKRENVLRT